MKKIILLLPLILTSLGVHAQWATSGTVTSTANTVGIGTTSPASSLSLGPSRSNKNYLFMIPAPKQVALDRLMQNSGYSEFPPLQTISALESTSCLQMHLRSKLE